MKLKPILAALMLCVPVAFISISTTGCVTTQQEVAYKSLRATWVAVDAAMLTAADLYKTGKITEADREMISGLHDKYRVAMDTAITAASLDWNTVTPSTVAALASEVVLTISKLSKP